MSATTTVLFETDPQLLRRLDKFAEDHSEINFYLGGHGAIKYTADDKPRTIIVTNSIEEII
ncbi:MAG: hypothetical protein K6T88_05755 [Bacillus sp. (in: Bacteria)]|nr:hypothetical protein [Bacillus sp. (in: firmicutes)]